MLKNPKPSLFLTFDYTKHDKKGLIRKKIIFIKIKYNKKGPLPQSGPFWYFLSFTRIFRDPSE